MRTIGSVGPRSRPYDVRVVDAAADGYAVGVVRQGRAAVAASGEWLDPDDGVRLPAGDVHAWLPGTNQTVCGLALSRSRLLRFAHVPFTQVLPESGGAADAVGRLCPRCLAATGVRPGRRWERHDPRP